LEPLRSITVQEERLFMRNTLSGEKTTKKKDKVKKRDRNLVRKTRQEMQGDAKKVQRMGVTEEKQHQRKKNEWGDRGAHPGDRGGGDQKGK